MTIGSGALDLPHFTTPGSKTQTNPMTVPNASETSPEPWRRSQAGANTSLTARPPASTKVRPSLPAFLRDQTVGDAGAAARAQYGGEVLAPLTNKRAPFSTISKEENSAGSRPRPSLPTGPKSIASKSTLKPEAPVYTQKSAGDKGPGSTRPTTKAHFMAEGLRNEAMASFIKARKLEMQEDAVEWLHSKPMQKELSSPIPLPKSPISLTRYEFYNTPKSPPNASIGEKIKRNGKLGLSTTLQGHFDDTPNPPPNASISEKARYVPEVFVHHGKPHEQRKQPDKPVRNTTNTSIQQPCVWGLPIMVRCAGGFQFSPSSGHFQR
ncbi:hypothetical protein JMJ35_006741 [Cladonia borealis]|uniref:Uncharacterized protein n=1 Tax=Cladonia borealis TaxID=184061 RepID=A0AA39R069_9LECA|nr:hypothetical protein JMJ35_006741 [Cladonia borealis]